MAAILSRGDEVIIGIFSVASIAYLGQFALKFQINWNIVL